MNIILDEAYIIGFEKTVKVKNKDNNIDFELPKKVETVLRKSSRNLAKLLAKNYPGISQNSVYFLKRKEKFLIKEISKMINPQKMNAIEIKRWSIYSEKIKTKHYNQIKNFFRQKLQIRVGLMNQEISKKVLIGLVKQVQMQKPSSFRDLSFELVENNFSGVQNKGIVNIPSLKR